MSEDPLWPLLNFSPQLMLKLLKDINECSMILTKLHVQLTIIVLLLAFQEKLFKSSPSNDNILNNLCHMVYEQDAHSNNYLSI